MSTRIGIAIAFVLAVHFPAHAQLPSFRVWPDTDAPCNGTLQACINGSLADDAIDVATNGPIDETLLLNRSIEIQAAPGFHPALAAGRGILALPDGGDRFYVIQGFKLPDGTISIGNNQAGGLTAWVFDNEADGIAVGALASGGPLSFRIEGNTLTPDFGEPGGILVYAAEAFGGGNQTNTVKGNTVILPPTNDAEGISLSVSNGNLAADVVGNRVTGSFYNAGIALRGDASPLTARIANNLVTGATASGVGILVFAQGTDGVRDVDIVNNTLAGNSSGIAVSQRDARVANNVITGNAIGLDLNPFGPAVVVNDHNLFFDNADDAAGQPAGPGSVFADPEYLDLVEFRPSPMSAVVDAGADDALPNSFTIDLAGDPRRIGTLDIGAYEVPEPSAGLAASAAFAGLAVLRSRGRLRRDPAAASFQWFR